MERAFDIDVIPGMQVDIDDNNLDRLLRSAISGTGVPYSFIDASNDIDFARSLAMQNQGFVKKVIIYQKLFGEYFTKIVRKLWDNEFIISNEDKHIKQVKEENSEENTINSQDILVSFPAPAALNINTVNEQLSSSEQLMTYLSELYHGDEEVEERRVFKKNLAKNIYLKNIDWDLVEKVFKESKVDLIEDKLEKEIIPSEENNEEEGTY